VPFFDSSTSKSCLKILCFVDVDFEICFAQLPNLVRNECASRCRRICHVASWLRTRRFREPTFRPYFSPLRSPNSLEKHSVSRLSFLSRICIFFLLTLSGFIQRSLLLILFAQVPPTRPGGGLP
jgi:hypothetical protein